MTGPGPYGIAAVPAGYRVGAWIVDEPLGAGAFGNVYAAHHTAPEPGGPARAALKFLPTGTHTPRQLRHLRELAEREVELLSRLRSPRLIRMYETLTLDDAAHPELDGATVLVLEAAEGSLETLLAAERRPQAGPGLLTQICEGLHQLHGAGWVHGDLKPGNVLLMPDGTARLGDFNMAAELEGTHAYAPAFATADYTPPELLWSEIGERGRKVRQTTDVWAFGVLAHLILAGSFPMPGGSPAARREAAVRYARGEDLRLSPDLPTSWRGIIQDCLARTHEERARHDATSLLRRTRDAAADRAPRRRRTRRPLLALAAGVLALAAAGFGIRMLVDDDPAAKPDTPAATGSAGSTGTAQTATGYDRCGAGSVCFFSEPDGGGRMCAWEGDDPDWFDGETDCSWAATERPRSLFNNGAPDPNGFLHVTYFAKPGLQQRLGCVEKGRRQDLALDSSVLSHTWAKSC
ncbi:serine/threonine-protein kinase [Streptomyces pristinaespiralis]|uniref:serine/threonine-protein kinase n=1 Tax=Streptomyces pristinaespiralis TaxID=38300 RepID=UPI0038385CB1